MRSSTFSLRSDDALPTKHAAVSQSVALVCYEQLHQLGIGYSRLHIRRLIRANRFPKAYQLGANRIAWRLDELTAWIHARPPAVSNTPKPPRPHREPTHTPFYKPRPKRIRRPGGAQQRGEE